MTYEKPQRRISLNEVMHRTNLKKTTIYERMKKSTFPARNPDGWLEADIDFYVIHGKVKTASNHEQEAQAA